jgi:O-methyltransferase
MLPQPPPQAEARFSKLLRAQPIALVTVAVVLLVLGCGSTLTGSARRGDATCPSAPEVTRTQSTVAPSHTPPQATAQPAASTSREVAMSEQARRLYLDLLRGIIIGFGDKYRFPIDFRRRAFRPDVYSVLSRVRMNNIEALVRDVVVRRVPGDIAETGVWRGGSMMFAQGVLLSFGEEEAARRRVWLCDSFMGIPPVNEVDFPADYSHRGHGNINTAVEGGAARVNASFGHLGLWRPNVRFVVGWFNETLARAPIARLAVLRLDGDLFESTILALIHLYPKLSPGGYLIVDDFPLWSGCVRAVTLFRTTLGITDPILYIAPLHLYAKTAGLAQESGVYWRRTLLGGGRALTESDIVAMFAAAKAMPKLD